MSIKAAQSSAALGWAWYFAHLHALDAERRDNVFRRLEAARCFLDGHIEHAVTLDEAAQRAHLSKFHFLRLFKATFHETPHRYLRRRRLEAATRLLRGTELPVTHICFRVGFESLGSFISLFRRVVGQPPLAFRKRYVVVPRSIIAADRQIPGCWLRRYGVGPDWTVRAATRWSYPTRAAHQALGEAADGSESLAEGRSR
jgi:AraC-like DNA-binding protein